MSPKALIISWSLHLDSRSRNTKPANEVDPAPLHELLLACTCMNTHRKSEHTQLPRQGTAWIDVDWAHAIIHPLKKIATAQVTNYWTTVDAIVDSTVLAFYLRDWARLTKLFQLCPFCHLLLLFLLFLLFLLLFSEKAKSHLYCPPYPFSSGLHGCTTFSRLKNRDHLSYQLRER